MVTVTVFPGQGSQSPGMGKELAENFAVARQVFEEADDALGFAISRLCFDGPAEDLQLTENTQPAILTVSVAAFRAMREAGIGLRHLSPDTVWVNTPRLWQPVL